MSDREKLWTAGPWWTERETGDVVARDGDWEICTFTRSDTQHPYDTQLISAAPDLVDALEACLRLLAAEDLPSEESQEAIDKSVAALNAAYGDSQ